MNFGIALLAVLFGNIVYYLLLPQLPPVLRHVPTRLDPGLALEFLLCLGIWLVLSYFRRRGIKG